MTPPLCSEGGSNQLATVLRVISAATFARIAMRATAALHLAQNDRRMVASGAWVWLNPRRFWREHRCVPLQWRWSVRLFGRHHPAVLAVHLSLERRGHRRWSTVRNLVQRQHGLRIERAWSRHSAALRDRIGADLPQKTPSNSTCHQQRAMNARCLIPQASLRDAIRRRAWTSSVD